MKKLKFYVLVLCSAVSVVSCDAIGRNKSALNELGKELAAVAEGTQKPEAAGSVAADAGDRLQMQKTPAGTPEQILRRTAYVASYNKETKLPNWVAWHLTASLQLLYQGAFGDCLATQKPVWTHVVGKRGE